MTNNLKTEKEKMEIQSSIVSKNTSMMPLGIDINKLVLETRSLYDKKEAGLAKQISTGVSLTLPEKDTDFIVWTQNDFWCQLTGIRGLQMGRLHSVCGKPDSGKSSLAMSFMVEAQKQQCLVILWDSEGKFAPKRYKEKMGGDPNSLIVVQTNAIIDGVAHIAHIVNTAKLQNPDLRILICWDSVGASLSTLDESDDYSKQPGQDAKQVSYACKQLNKLIFKHLNKETGQHSICGLIINQVYSNIGSVGTKMRGGDQLYYLCSLILELTRRKDLNKVKKGIAMKFGIQTKGRVRKNHLFNGEDCVAELDLEVSAAGIKLFKAGKISEDEEIVEVDEE